MSIELICRKLGMTRIYDDQGQAVPVTVLEAGPNSIVQKKTEERDGYTALQLGFGERRPKNVGKSLLGHFGKSGVTPKRILRESRLQPQDAESWEPGQEIKADVFQAGQQVDVIGTSKGRGTAGVVKRHGFATHRATHGTHEFFRHGGSIGASAFPARVIKGKKMPGRLGNAATTTRNLQVVRVDLERNLLFLRGSVPGHNDAFVRVRPAVQP